MYNQISLFDGDKPFVNDKAIRLIELFGGYGSQALSLKYLGVSFEHYKLSEWACKSIQAYKDMHFCEDNTDYSKSKSAKEIKQWLYGRISSDYNNPMTEEQINRLSEKQVRAIYNNMQATHNLGSITQIKAEDLEVVDTDKYCYIMTYSFPCQDLSQAGQGKGMSKDSGTRSGLLWEVERLLLELNQTKSLPTVLLLENVPQIVGKTGIHDFAKWIARLEELGYKNYWQCLNAKDYGIPQNRNRCFMISILDDCYYSFPKPQKLTVYLKDFLDKEVNEKYYLSDKNVEFILDINNICSKSSRGDIGDRKVNPKIAKTISCRGAADQRADVTNFVVNDNQIEYTVSDLRKLLFNQNKIKCKQVGQIVGNGFTEMTGRVYSVEGLTPSIRTFSGGNTEVKIAEPIAYDEQSVTEEPIIYDMYNKKEITNGICGTLTCNGNTSATHCGTFGVLDKRKDYRIRKLTERECFRLQGVKSEDFERVRYGKALPYGSHKKIVNRIMTKAEWKVCWRIMRHNRQSTSSCYHLCGDAICVSVLMAIFGELLGIKDYKDKIKDLAKELKTTKI